MAPLLPGMEAPPHAMRLGDDEKDYYVQRPIRGESRSAVLTELGVKGQYPVKTGVPPAEAEMSGPDGGPPQSTANAAAGGMSGAAGDAVQPEGHRK